MLQLPIVNINSRGKPFQQGYEWHTVLTHWGRVTHIRFGKLTIIVSDNGLSLRRRQAIIWTNAGILLIGPLGINFSEILIEVHTFSFKKMHLKPSSAKWQPLNLGLNVLTNTIWTAVGKQRDGKSITHGTHKLWFKVYYPSRYLFTNTHLYMLSYINVADTWWSFTH